MPRSVSGKRYIALNTVATAFIAVNEQIRAECPLAIHVHTFKRPGRRAAQDERARFSELVKAYARMPSTQIALATLTTYTMQPWWR
ncbi:hypothetical protein CR155_01750 [Pollutimonas nitritireducens]|uniref:Uncharacterized protein n=1 Tax=Pollutimonas nitritireducens TaxID=2045209 RepID=A0A2N4ULA9_9BURK|nr:hypothetical protein CR155_01750 [Pollutimonas nitritireducens]